MRVVRHPSELKEAWDRCAAEAQAAFGRADLYIEEYIPRARHIEVQIVGDVYGNVVHLFERECSVQRRHQKIIELAPSPWLPPELRDRLAADAVRLAQTTRYVGVGTVEFLVEVDEQGASTGRHIFIELNPRLQVEHTVTEEVLNVDIVRAQLQIARGLSLDEIGLRDAARRGPVGFAMQLRINTEVFAPDGSLRSASGTLAAFNPSSGKGVRVETAGYAGATIHPGFDALLAKLVVSAPDLSFPELTARAYRALCEFQIEGVETNLPLLQKLIRSDEFIAGRIDTGYVDRHAKALAVSGADSHPKLHPPAQAGVQDSKDEHAQDAVLAMHPGCEAFRSPMGGTLVALQVAEGALVRAGQAVGIVEAMKMENVLAASASGRIETIVAGAGHAVQAGDILFMFSPAEETSDDGLDISGAAESSRALVEDMLARKAALLDEGRPEAMAKLTKRGSLSARARIAALCDSDSFQEIGGFVRAEYARDDAPADGMILGTGKIDGRPVVVIAQDFSVYGGSSGHLGSTKLDRAATIALQAGIPLIMLLDGGGHRIQDGQSSRHYASGAGIIMQELAHLSGWAPIVGAILGFGLAGNTNFTAFADHLVMVRERAVMGIAGPALVKVATGETISAETLGGADVQVDQNGLADVGVESEEAVRVHSEVPLLPAVKCGRAASGRGPGANADRGGAGAGAVGYRAGQHPAKLRRAASYRIDRRRRQRLREEADLRAQYRDELRPARWPAGRLHRQPVAGGGRHAGCSSLREGRAFHRDLRRVRPAHYISDRRAGGCSRVGRRENHARAAQRQARPRDRTVDGAARFGGAAQRVRHGLRGDGGRALV
jgi:biotin carboxyl carrier protein/acetyl-CoA carboxylase beta subunit